MKRNYIKKLRPFLMIIGLLGLVTITDIGCVIRFTTGIPCPGCGMTRAFLTFMSGSFLEAFRYHPLFWLVPICAVVIAFERKTPTGEVSKNVNRFYMVCVVLFLVTYLLRMILMFPDTAPMTFNKSAPLYKLINFFRK